MRITYDGTLRQLLERYYGHVNRLDNLDIANFLERRQAVLPRYRASFKEAQDVTGIDWRMTQAACEQVALNEVARCRAS